MTYYIGLVHKEKDFAFGVQFPDVPGCFSAADESITWSAMLPSLEPVGRGYDSSAPAALKKLFRKRTSPRIWRAALF